MHTCIHLQINKINRMTIKHNLAHGDRNAPPQQWDKEIEKRYFTSKL